MAQQLQAGLVRAVAILWALENQWERKSAEIRMADMISLSGFTRGITRHHPCPLWEKAGVTEPRSISVRVSTDAL